MITKLRAVRLGAIAAAIAAGVGAAILLSAVTAVPRSEPPAENEGEVAATVRTATPLPTTAEEGNGREAAERFLRELTGSNCSGSAFVTIGIEPGIIDRAAELGPNANVWLNDSVWLGDPEIASAHLGGTTLFSGENEVWVVRDAVDGVYAQQLRRISIEGMTLWAMGDQVSSVDPTACEG